MYKNHIEGLVVVTWILYFGWSLAMCFVIKFIE